MENALQGPLEGIAARVNRLLDRTVAAILEIGQELQSARGMLREDENFAGWLAENCPRISRRSAYRYIGLAVAFPNGLENAENYDLSAVYVLAEPGTPQEVRDEAAACATVAHVTRDDVESMIESAEAWSEDAETETEPEPEQAEDAAGARPAREIPKTPSFWREVERSLDRATELLNQHAEDCYLKSAVLESLAEVVREVDDLKTYLA